MDLNALKMFISVVQAGSFSRASEKSGIPLATLSRKIAELEKSLKIQLLDRAKVGVKPTAMGQQLYEQVHLSLDNLAQVEQLFSQSQSHLSGKLRLACFSGFTLLFDWVDEFMQRYPDVQIHCEVGDRIVDMIEDGIDIAFRMGELHTENMIVRPLFAMQSMIVANPKLFEKQAKPQKPEDLAQFRCLGWARTGHQAVEWQFGQQKIRLPYVFASNDVGTLYYLAQKGNTICQLPKMLAERLIADHHFIPLLREYHQPHYPIHLLYPAHRYPSALVKTFVDFCLEKSLEHKR